MKIRNKTNKLPVTVDDALAKELLDTGMWERADKPAPKPKADDTDE